MKHRGYIMYSIYLGTPSKAEQQLLDELFLCEELLAGKATELQEDLHYYQRGLWQPGLPRELGHLYRAQIETLRRLLSDITACPEAQTLAML